MKRILIVDPLSYSGHVNYNYGLIRAIAQNYDYDIMVNKFVFQKLQGKGVDKEHFVEVFPDDWNIESLSKRMNKLFYHILFRYYFLKVLFSAKNKKKDYDAMLITCIDIYSFVLVSWLLGNDCYVVDHGVGNVASNRCYRLAWQMISKRIHLIVLEDFIKRMVTDVINDISISVVRHPLPVLTPTKEEGIGIKVNTILLFGPSGSNDEQFLKKLTEYNIPDNVRIVAKSNLFNFKSSQLYIYKDYLSSDDYQDYLKQASYILLPYSADYNYRISAVLFEAMVLRKPIMLLDNNTLSYYHDIFRGSICLFSSVDDLINKIKDFTPHYLESTLIPYTDVELAKCFTDVLG